MGALPFAAVDPNAALADKSAARPTTGIIDSGDALAQRLGIHERPSVEVSTSAATPNGKSPHPQTLVVTVAPPPPIKRWRFFLFWCLIRLAAKAYPFEFQIYRTPKPWEEPEW